MLPNLKPDQSVFLEITNPIHGGPGWEFGSCLWSPMKDKGGSEAWKVMNDTTPGDMIIHLLKLEEGYVWAGVSKAITSLTQSIDEPPRPDRWANMSPYQRINVGQYSNIAPPPKIQKFFEKYEQQLRDILRDNTEGMFYVEYGDSKDLRVAQKYFAKVPLTLYNLFKDYSDSLNITIQFDYENKQLLTKNEPAYPDYTSPGRTKVVTSRIIRDTKLVRQLKTEFNWNCQICGKRISLEDNKFYAEGHHLKPLGGEYNGPDIRENIIILCPFHHAEFDYGSMSIHPVSNTIIHANSENEYNNKSLAYNRGDLGKEFIEFHYNKIFWGKRSYDRE